MISLGGEQETTPLWPAGSECIAWRASSQTSLSPELMQRPHCDSGLEKQGSSAPMSAWHPNLITLWRPSSWTDPLGFHLGLGPLLMPLKAKRNPEPEKIQFTHRISELVGNLQCTMRKKTLGTHDKTCLLYTGGISLRSPGQALGIQPITTAYMENHGIRRPCDHCWACN